MHRSLRWIRRASHVIAISMLACTLEVVAATHPAFAQASPFEGVVHMTMTGQGQQSVPVAYYIKGNAARMEVQAQGMQMAMIMDMGAKKMYMVLPSQQMYMETSLEDMQNRAEAMEGNVGEPKVTKTGRTETVAGHQCEHWIISSSVDSASADVCMAKGIGTFMQGSSPMSRGRPEPTWQREAREQGMFPLKVTSSDGSVALEVTSIERKPLDASLFQPPSDYQKMPMPGMPGRP
jgi:hypothetical protein